MARRCGNTVLLLEGSCHTSLSTHSHLLLTSLPQRVFSISNTEVLIGTKSMNCLVAIGSADKECKPLIPTCVYMCIQCVYMCMYTMCVHNHVYVLSGWLVVHVHKLCMHACTHACILTYMCMYELYVYTHMYACM